MTSQVSLPTNWDEIQAMPENNSDNRGDKVDAIHNFMLTNNIDSSRFENRDGLIWPGAAAAQRLQLADMIEAVNSFGMRGRDSPQFVPQSPLSGFSQPGTPRSDMDGSNEGSSAFRPVSSGTPSLLHHHHLLLALHQWRHMLKQKKTVAGVVV